MNLKNLFKKKKKNIGNFKIRVSTSCEDPNTTYLTFPRRPAARYQRREVCGMVCNGM
jgi:hypothetical protein